jgi:cell filamentation protein
MSPRYDALGLQAAAEPGSRGRVLANRLGITRVRDMHEAESQALQIAQNDAIERYNADHRFKAADIQALHRAWLWPIYEWAGEYRAVDLSKGGFRFANAAQIPRLMAELERGALAEFTPLSGKTVGDAALGLAVVHAELILVHPFREGNGRLSRLLAMLMGLQAGFPPLDFSPMLGRGRQAYISGIHSALGRDYQPLARMFKRVIDRSLRTAASSSR